MALDLDTQHSLHLPSLSHQWQQQEELTGGQTARAGDTQTPPRLVAQGRTPFGAGVSFFINCHQVIWEIIPGKINKEGRSGTEDSKLLL